MAHAEVSDSTVQGLPQLAEMKASSQADDSSPWKNLSSYEAADETKFRGRRQAAAALFDTILAEPLTILHAPSGAGKTSLLNAAVRPNLERAGWIVVRTTPGLDPVGSVRSALLAAIAPEPVEELSALNLLAALPDAAGIFEGMTADAASDPASPRPQARNQELVRSVARHPSWFGRLLGGTIALDDIHAHLRRVARQAPAPILGETDPKPTTIAEFATVFASDEYTASIRKIRAHVTDSEPRIMSLLTTLDEHYAASDEDLRLALFIDQFEELFTLFVDAGPLSRNAEPSTADWRVKNPFFRDLRDTYDAARGVGRRTFKRLAVRIVLSLREDYLGALEPVRRMSPLINDAYFRLGHLTETEARAVITEPPRLFGVTVSKACEDAIIAGLIREEAFVEPSHLQIVCPKLWSRKPPEATTLEVEQIPPTGISGILRDFFREFLEKLGPDQREETLEMFDSLITPSRTRNIVSRDALVNAPYRRPEIRGALIKQLTVTSRFLREERRGEIRFVEVTHEFLIGPVLEALHDSQRQRFLHLRYVLEHLHNLEMGRGSADRVDRDRLTAADCQVLHDARDHLKLTAWAISTICQSILEHDFSPLVVGEWAVRLSGSAPDFGWLMSLDAERRAARLAVLSRLEFMAMDRHLRKGMLSDSEKSVLLRRMMLLARHDDWALVSGILGVLSDEVRP